MFPIPKNEFIKIITKFQSLNRNNFNRFYNKKNEFVLQYLLKSVRHFINKTILDSYLYENELNNFDFNDWKPNKNIDIDYKFHFSVIVSLGGTLYIDHIYIKKDYDYKKYLSDYFLDENNKKDVEYYLNTQLKLHKLKYQNQIIKELIEYFYHPKRIDKWIYEIDD